MQFTRQQINALRIASIIERLRPVYLDTETTGLSAKDQVVELAILDDDSAVLLNALMQPTCAMSEGAARTHGITPEMLTDKYFLRDWWPRIGKLLAGRFIVGYNVTYDLRMLLQTAGEQGVEIPSISFLGAFDMMQIYSAWASVPGKFGHYKWFKLADAAQREGIEPNGNLHRALADTDLTRRLTLALSGIYTSDDGVTEEATVID